MRVPARKLKPEVICGDMREVLARMPAQSVDAVVTDPPYGLSFMGRDWDQQVPGPGYWREVLRVCKPGAHLLAFGGTRTAHRLACAIEDSGFTLRDCISYLFGSGFPKSHDVSKAIDREHGAVREVVGRGQYAARGRRTDNAVYGEATPSDLEVVTAPATNAARAWDGFGTALKPAHEPIYLARKPFSDTVASNVQVHGCGALNIDACRIGFRSTADRMSAVPGSMPGSNHSIGTFATRDRSDENPAALQNTLGRWPANVALDEEAAAVLDAQTGQLTSGALSPANNCSSTTGWAGGSQANRFKSTFAPNSGGASRFFYTSKASRAEREAGLSASPGTRANGHPTVKPIALMRWLVRLVTPPGGVVLDPFAGSGSTGCAAVLEGFRFIGIELDPGYADIARARIAHRELSPRGDNSEGGKPRCRVAL